MKNDKYGNARLAGMEYARQRIKDIGMEKFDEEMETRNRNHLDFTFSKQEERDMMLAVTESTLRMLIYCLHDRFGFGEKRCQAVVDLFNSRMSDIADGAITWFQVTEVLRDEMDIDIQFT